MLYLGVAQLVARYLGVVEAAGSSPVTQTISSIHKGFDFMNTRFFYMLLRKRAVKHMVLRGFS